MHATRLILADGSSAGHPQRVAFVHFVRFDSAATESGFELACEKGF